MNKIIVTPEQLTYLEALVIGYMLIAENKEGFSEPTMTSLLAGLDVKWEGLFEEVKMKGVGDIRFSEILDKINSMSRDELLQKIKETPNSGVGYAIFGSKEEQENNEESEMIKKIKVVNKGTSSLENEILCDTAIGNEYLATFIGQGMSTPHGGIAEQDSLSFKDDIGDWVTIWVADETYEVVACHEESINE